MNLYDILKGIAILGIIISAIMEIAGWASLKFIFKLEKYKDKLVEETPLLASVNVMYTGLILLSVFTGILIALMYFE